MDKVLTIIIAGTVVLMVALVLVSMMGSTADDITGTTDEAKTEACGQARDTFESEKDTGSLLEARRIMERANQNGCVWPEDASIDYEPEECPSEWVVAC